MKPIAVNLWFDTQAEEAAEFYTSVFPRSKIGAVTRYPKAGQEITGQAPGTVMTVAFEINGQPFIALNGGPHFRFSEAISIVVQCDTQTEIDEYWQKLSADPAAEQCGWLKDKFGVSWQIVPAGMEEIMDGPHREAAFARMLAMKKLDIAQLKAAA